MQRRTAFRYLGYLDGSRELEYLRDDLGDTLSTEIAEFQAEVAKATSSFDKDKKEEFEKKVTILEGKRADLDARISNIGDMIGGEIPVRKEMYDDVNDEFQSRINAIPQDDGVIVNRLKALADFN